ncbi:hypothetical protein NliqN6_3319 [Naganishia liquefaciens]|uniref:NAD(P)H-hydrate epimerase n=1 Tax=Naganishia liquefaciens TaxID=104408 RepID=A0A8H3TTK6_9TREE|nr:hypothetical protein NliqN6_3319 [Naganishia liquefaciens]
MSSSIKYITADEAVKIDQELMSDDGAFSLDQLMELAGLACAQTVARTFPAKTHRRVLVIVGPGNQGGDGLVAARHLHMFGYEPTIYQPKPGNKDIYNRLLKQCQNLHIPSLPTAEAFQKHYDSFTDVILDTIFGFSFHPPVRSPFDAVLRTIAAPDKGTKRVPIVSIDIPSGWSVQDGAQKLQDEQGGEVPTFEPEVLLSLTCPKVGVKEFKGRHFLGGRFVPDDMVKKYEMNLPDYPANGDQIVEL